jgi:spermidine synthase
MSDTGLSLKAAPQAKISGSGGVLLPLSLALWASGAAGLVFQILWFQQASLAFGNTVVAASVILSSFMAGLGFGNAAAGRLEGGGRRFIDYYAGLELTVAGSGVALTYGLPRLASRDLSLLLPFVLLLVPATAMGATLPILIAAVREWDNTSYGRALGTLYGWNTLGAVAGALLVESTLIPSFGIAGSAWVAAALDALAAFLALRAGRRVRASAQPVGGNIDVSPMSAGSATWLLLCAGMSGFVLLALEVIWFRFLSMFVLTTTLVMSTMLAVVLAGIALGGLTAARWIGSGDRSGLFAALSLAAALTVPSSYVGFTMLTSGAQIVSMSGVLWCAAVMTFPTSFASGMLFTLLGDAIRRRGYRDARAAAALTCANTLGAACGPPVAAFVLLPVLGTERAFFALSIGYIVIAAAGWSGRLRPDDRLERGITIVAAAVTLLILIRFPLGLMTTTHLLRVVQPYTADGSQIVATREGPTESIVLLQQPWMGAPVYSRLVTNGFSMSGTAIPGQRYMRYFIDWPMLMHATPIDRVLIIGFGVGVTLDEALAATPARSIDLAEISSDILETGDVIYGRDRNPARDARVSVHLDDGRHFLQRTRQTFDLITGEPPPPRAPGAVHIYTREYFRLVRDHLADGGMATYWLPVARPNPGTDVDTIIRAFCDAFDDCSMWNATPFDLMLVGTRDARVPPAADAIAHVWATPVGERLREVGFETPEQIGATFLGDADYLRSLTARTPPLTDDFPQRLRPAADRPSLSDPRYPTDPTVVAEYRTVLDPVRAREAFSRSAFISRLWPPALAAASPPWFEQQARINRVLWEGGKPLRLIEDLDAVLTGSSLRTLPLWILGSDATKQRIAASGNDGTGTVEYLRGIELMVTREYADAASYLGLAERRGLHGPTVRPLIAYALCRAGRVDLSKQVLATIQPGDDDSRHAVDWMAAHCR